jgi:MFS family permease
MYNCFLALGVAFGTVIDGFVSINYSWRYMYYIAVAPIGFCTIIVILFFPETFYPRSPVDLPAQEDYAPKKTFIQSMTIFTGVHTKESLFRMFIRPVGLVIIPPILWATLVMSVTIGFLVAVSSNVAPSFQTEYGMQPWQTGLCFVAAIIGSVLGMWLGGSFSDRVADYFTKRNGGIREPEFRLPAMMIALITGPLSLIFYGVGIDNGVHWMMPTIGLGLVTFTIVQGTNVSFVYILDSYRPIAGAPFENLIQARRLSPSWASNRCSVSYCHSTQILGSPNWDIPRRMVQWLGLARLFWFYGSRSLSMASALELLHTMPSICNGSSGIPIANQGNSLEVGLVSCISTLMNKCITIFSDTLNQIQDMFFSFEGYP